MQVTQGLRRAAALHGARDATVFGDRVTSWSLLKDRVARLAGGLQAQGLRPGERVAILSANSDRYAEAYYAVAWAGGVSVPYNVLWAPAELDGAIEDCRPKLALLDDKFATRSSYFASCNVPVIGMDEGVGAISCAQLIAETQPLPDQCRQGDDLACIFYTGGTTGRSKGVMLSHANLVTDFLLQQAVAPYDRDTVFLHVAPMFHAGEANFLFGLTSLGASHVILPGFDANATIDAVEQKGVTAMALVPTMIGVMCETLRTRSADLSGVQRLTYGASPISSSVLQMALEAFPRAKFVQCYGQTEVSPVATILDHTDHLAGRLRSAGRAVPGVDVRVVDPAMADVPVGEVGEIIIRGPITMAGYWNQPEITEATLVEGWLRTGDAGYLDTDAYLYLADRVKDMIVSGGENVYSVEVENALMQHPDVLQCAVIGVPHEHWGEAVHAVVCLRRGSAVTEAELLSHCSPLIANYKRPKSFSLGFAPLPLSGVGKVLKAELRKPYWEGRSRLIG